MITGYSVALRREEIERMEKSLGAILLVSRDTEAGLMIETVDSLRDHGFYNIHVASTD